MNIPPNEIRDMVVVLEHADGLTQIEGMSKRIEETGIKHAALDHQTLAALIWLAREGVDARKAPVKLRFGT